jgi:hypothetical protein
MFTVSVLDSNGQWQTTTESTLSACVKLTLGLECRWAIHSRELEYKNLQAQLLASSECRSDQRRYDHTLRSLIQRWVKRVTKTSPMLLLSSDCDKLRYWFRLSDTELLRILKVSSAYRSIFGDRFAIDANPELFIEQTPFTHFDA